MNDALFVRRGHAASRLRGDVTRLAHRQPSFLQTLPQRFAFEQLGDEKRRAVMRAGIVNGKDIRMIERRNRARLLLESPQPFGIGGKGRRQNFDCDFAAQTRIPRPVHLAHAARAHRDKNFIGAKFRSGRETHLRCLRRPREVALASVMVTFAADSASS